MADDHVLRAVVAAEWPARCRSGPARAPRRDCVCENPPVLTVKPNADETDR